MTQTRNIQVIKDLDGRNIVIINDIIFKGKRHINWKEVEAYLKKYVGEFYEIAESKDIVYIGSDLPREYLHSKYTKGLTRSYKNKANLITAIPELIEIASNKKYRINTKGKHKNDAKKGWLKYDARFAFPLYDNNKQIMGYTIFKAILIIRIASDNKLYLYDIIQIFKEK